MYFYLLHPVQYYCVIAEINYSFLQKNKINVFVYTIRTIFLGLVCFKLVSGRYIIAECYCRHSQVVCYLFTVISNEPAAKW
jgi:hypothetical protein